MGAAERKAVLAALPPNLIALIDEIERFAGVELGFEKNTVPSLPNDPNPYSAAVDIGPKDATILLWDFDQIDAVQISHELLHVRRYWLEGVPMVHALRNVGDNSTICTTIDNDIEHLVIIPEQRRMGFDPDEYWASTSRLNWSTYPWPKYTIPFARRKNCLLGWLGTQLCTDPEVHDLARSCLKTEGLLSDAVNLHGRLQKLISSKPRMTSAVMRFLGIPPKEGLLAYLDIRNGSIRKVPVPDN